ncbi:putative protein N(5)-glutamine methyltransferase [Specibacter cremeus]|uniref:putative protein N(5)-glutamine methyltransferase n=1 Tax=Specibacter cremeus TaxID=1629051 RepID=UPI000F7A9A61|nr:putative protein N(5)-glutamine methyltransferase [Specibacter cremeus]
MQPLTDDRLDELVSRLRAAGCVFAEDEAAVLAEAAANESELAALAARRVAGDPLEHLVGWAVFGGRRMAVAPGVFVPRRRTEYLARRAAKEVRRAVAGTAAGRAPGDAAVVVLELCCGVAAVGATLAADFPGLEVHAADIDPAAVACARRNLPGGRVYCGDLFEPLPPRLRGRIAVIAANAPYVPTGEIPYMPPEARLHEPDVALNGGPDGLDIQRRVAGQARAWLAPGGVLLLETSVRQGPESRRILQSHGFAARIRHSSRLEATVVIGRS